MRGGLQCPAGGPVVVSGYGTALAYFADIVVCKAESSVVCSIAVLGEVSIGVAASFLIYEFS